MAEQIAFMHEAGSIPRLGAFPGGCSVRYDDATWEVLEVRPLGFTPAQPEDENATQPLESPVVETPTPVDEPPAPTQIYINGG